MLNATVGLTVIEWQLLFKVQDSFRELHMKWSGDILPVTLAVQEAATFTHILHHPGRSTSQSAVAKKLNCFTQVAETMLLPFMR